jgi:DNA-directed RNA polymerase specialized sigma24 family protein
VIVRNAGKWYRVGNHARDWRGYVIILVPTITRRCTDDERPPVREQPPGGPPSGGAASFTAPIPSSAPSPDQLAEFRELIDLVASVLSAGEQRLLRWLVDEGRTIADLAAELGRSESAVQEGLKRLLAKLRRLFGRRG